jgi:hypothetical protein
MCSHRLRIPRHPAGNELDGAMIRIGLMNIADDEPVNFN